MIQLYHDPTNHKQKENNVSPIREIAFHGFSQSKHMAETQAKS